MKRWLFEAAVLCIAGWLIWLNWPRTTLEVAFGLESCRNLALTDADTGKPITGIEDIALMPDGSLVLSAHDRLDPAEPDGGLYRLVVPDAAIAEASLSSLIDPSEVPGGLRPHGITLSNDPATDRDQVLVINRPRNGEMRQLIWLSLKGDGVEATSISSSPQICAANDLVQGDDRTWVTVDRASCPGLSLGEMVGWKQQGRVIGWTFGGQASDVRNGLFFPNGITLLPDRPHPIVAETRGERLIALSPMPGIEDSVDLPGAPDNLTTDRQGHVIAALHPSLPELALYRHGWISRAHSRIARVDMESGDVEMLFDDPGGTLLSAATVAVLTEGRLIAGSVRDGGLLICERS